MSSKKVTKVRVMCYINNQTRRNEYVADTLTGPTSQELGDPLDVTTYFCSQDLNGQTVIRSIVGNESRSRIPHTEIRDEDIVPTEEAKERMKELAIARAKELAKKHSLETITDPNGIPLQVKEKADKA